MLAKHTQKKSSRWVGFFIGTLTMVSTFAFALSADQIMGSKLDSPANENVNPGEVVTEPEIQKIADRALNAALKRHKATLGFIVVSDAATGRLLAVANKDLIETEFERSPHWALSLKMGPHSLAKAIVASAAVEKKVTSFDEVHNCEMGKYNFGGKVYQDWKPFDKLSTADLLAHSSNICGIKVGQKLGAQGISQALKNFGFGAGGSAKDFPEAREGEIPAPSTDEPLYISTILTGYGGIYVSPIEIVQAFGAIANGGNLLKPQTAKSSVEPIVVRRILSEETARKTREVLATVMTKGTARSSGSKLYRLAGKTATGYSRTHAEHDTLGGESNMASFAGFGPVEKPRVVIYVGIENPHDGKGVHGSYHAAPVFREVAEKTLRYLKVPVASAH